MSEIRVSSGMTYYKTIGGWNEGSLSGDEVVMSVAVLLDEIMEARRENTALKAVLAEVEKQTARVRELLRVAANNMAVLHHE